MSTEGSTRAVVAALLANMGIAVSKFVGFAITGSSSMLAEAGHSVADSGNQALLLLGNKRSQRRATLQHPFGYGRERYIYSFIVAIILFSLGGLFALYEGFHKLEEVRAGHGELEAPLVALGILGVAIVLESLSFRTAIHESNRVRGDQSWWGFIRHAKIPELPVVLLEDLGALVGLVLAALGVFLAMVTHNPVWDAVGTLSIGILLVIIAVTLAVETKSLVVGEGAVAEDLTKIERALVADPRVERVIHMRTMYLGPEELLVAAKVAVPADTTAVELAETIDAAEERLRAAVPVARVVYLEPDIFSPERARGAHALLSEG